MSDHVGAFIYVGKTGSGKTTNALADLRADASATGWPTLILDMMPAKNFIGLPHEKDVDGVLRKLYKPGEICGAVFTPDEEDMERDFDPLMRAILDQGRVHIVLDELRLIGSWRSIRRTFTKLLRGWRHAGGGIGYSLRMTTQRPGDVHNDVWACDPTVYAFRIDAKSTRDLETMQERFGWTPEQLTVLERGQFLTHAEAW